MAVVSIAAALCPGAAAADAARSGEQIYKQTCARCHGAAGEGTPDNYPKVLAGDKSVAQLAKLIAKRMPEDDPGTCVGEDADKVAAYIAEAFYSPTAQARNKPPRIELSRLTVRQYRNATADLIGIPWQILVGPKGLAEGKVEVKRRAGGTRDLMSPAEAVARIAPTAPTQAARSTRPISKASCSDGSAAWVRKWASSTGSTRSTVHRRPSSTLAKRRTGGSRRSRSRGRSSNLGSGFNRSGKEVA